MKRTITASLAALCLLAIVCAPRLPWSARLHKNLSRLRVKALAQMSRWQGNHPRTVMITGRLAGYGAQVEALHGARVIAAESMSGYSAMSDTEGRFFLPHLTWFPGASYNLLIAADAYHLGRLKLEAPSTCPSNGILDFGELRFEAGDEFDNKVMLVRPMKYDVDNAEFYTGMFLRLTADQRSDESAIDSICKYVAGKLNYEETTMDFHSPRQILERGSCYCSNLALAMAAITAAGNYPTRTVHLSDSPEHKYTHVVVEVYYGDRWHLYDPTYGVSFRNRSDEIASYKDVRLDPGLVTLAAFSGVKRDTAESVLTWMPKAYETGFHQIYEVIRSDGCIDSLSQ
jgi:Transglutaminase-like superfamily